MMMGTTCDALLPQMFQICIFILKPETIIEKEIECIIEKKVVTTKKGNLWTLWLKYASP